MKAISKITYVSAVVAVTLGLMLGFVAPVQAAIGDGTADSCTPTATDPCAADPSGVQTLITDHGTERMGQFVTLFVAMFLFSITLALIGLGIRKALGKLMDLFAKA